MNTETPSLPQTDTAMLPIGSLTSATDERDRRIISAVKLNGNLVVTSQYEDDTWKLGGAPSNRSSARSIIDFNRVPISFRSAIKEVVYEYITNGRDGGVRPATTTAVSRFNQLVPFLRHLESLRIKHLGQVTPMTCATYVAACKEVRQVHRSRGKPLSQSMLEHRYRAVEMLYELSQLTKTPIPMHPWPENSAKHLAGMTGHIYTSKTPLIPDDIFARTFNIAWEYVQRSEQLLDLRDGLNQLAATLVNKTERVVTSTKSKHLRENGWDRGIREFTVELNGLRTACYIVVASLSGCRNHELAYVQNGACYCTKDAEGRVYWWMRSRSQKTGAGNTEWMVPEAAVRALGVMERWAAPLQARLIAEIKQRQEINPLDPEIAEMNRHVNAIFLGEFSNFGNRVRTLGDCAWSVALRMFVARAGLDWNLSSHQFRRKFANYAARSKFGDLRYLREHFKHWSQDMTNDSYALNESQEMELYAEIQDELDNIKLGVSDIWLNSNEPLAGGYGKNLLAWRNRGEHVALYKDRASMVRSVADSHAIRSNGHAWCTADDNRCIGNTFDRTRCSSCNNAVIGVSHARLYQRFYDDLKEVSLCEDIGTGGHARVIRDMERCRDVLKSLGYDPEGPAP